MPAKKYKLGVAFSGGGARIAAHCGALQALIEYGLEPDIVSGTSAGSLIAVMYSCGFTPLQMCELFADLDFFKDILVPDIPKGGLFSSKPLMELIRRYIPYKNLEDLPIPTVVVASDVDHGHVKCFSKGEIAPRLVASCSIPIVFKPVVIGGVHYVDGGAFMTMPVSPIRNKCEKVIGLTLKHMDNEPYKDNLAYVASRCFEMMFFSNTAAEAPLADIYMELDTEGGSVFDLSKSEDLFFQGYYGTIDQLVGLGYTRVKPKEKIVFPHRETSLERIKEHERQVLDTLERRLGAKKAFLLDAHREARKKK